MNRLLEIGIAHTKPIHTLGPAGTDSHALAARLTEQTRLHENFEQAMVHAWEADEMSLIPCGYVKKTASGVADSWADLHFRWFEKMQILRIGVFPTKRMVLAVRDPSSLGSAQAEIEISIHPTTESLLNSVLPGAKRSYVGSKPDAVAQAASGAVDGCIGSEDIVLRQASLTPVASFEPEMVWCLYSRHGTQKHTQTPALHN